MSIAAKTMHMKPISPAAVPAVCAMFASNTVAGTRVTAAIRAKTMKPKNAAWTEMLGP